MNSRLLYTSFVLPVGTATIDSILEEDGKITIDFLSPESDGGQTITNYQYSLDGGENWTARSPEDLSSPIIVDELVNGTTYFVMIRVVFEGGFGPNSNEVLAIPFTVPSSPTITNIDTDNQKLLVGFTPGFNGGRPITNYEFSIDDGLTWTPRSPSSISSPILLTGLTNATTYDIKIRAVNIAGEGVESNMVQGTPTIVPSSSPTITSVDQGFTQLSVNFTEPEDDGGSAVTNYQFSTNGGTTWTTRSPASISSPLIISGLTNGTSYDVRIRAISAAGNGAQSNQITQSAGSPPLQPNAPTVVNTNAIQRLDVSWTAPNNGGFAITGYTLERRLGSGAWSIVYTGTATSFNDPGLSTASSYQYRVFATNSLGNSSFSNASTAINPANVPNTPSAPSVSNATLARLDASWTAPANNNLTITGYTLQRRLGTGAWSNVYTGPNLSFIDTGVALGSSYQYRVLATNALGSSAYSSESIARTVQGVVVPNVLSLNLSTATAFLNNAGLVRGTVFLTATVNGDDHDWILSQNPAPGTVVASGSSVSLNQRHLTVPNLIGRNHYFNEPQSLLSIARLSGSGSPFSGSFAPSGAVISQNPSSGTFVTPFSFVSYTYQV
jgi:hypothetical protein